MNNKFYVTRPVFENVSKEEFDAYVKQYPRKPQTNADRIRAMSDEELAEYHAEKCGCPHDPIVFGCRMATIGCIGCWLDWLRQEASDG